jgi:hypothetical protein
MFVTNILTYSSIFFRQQATENNCVVPSLFSRWHPVFNILQLVIPAGGGGGGSGCKPIGSTTSPPPPSCNLVHNGVEKAKYSSCVSYFNLFLMGAVTCLFV